jgi:putative phosphoserine phosphatase/1-acylglycerol-3-phosphate O-acyltransferase
MSGAAAIFDLDRTLLKSTSSAAFNEALFEAGLVRRRRVPGQGLIVRAYELIGETLPSIALARLASAAVAGCRVDDVGRAARAAAERLVADVVPWARPLIDHHRDAGRPLVMATTSPYDMVEPLADLLGFDHVIATRWATRVDEAGTRRYTGHLEGPFVWGTGKLGAVVAWAEGADVSLADSWVYSDSVYDLPLLLASGHPTAVNPDLRLHGVALLGRWPVANLDAPPGVTKVLGAELQDVMRTLTPRAAFPYARFDIAGTHHLPSRGPVIVAANHRSYFDPIAFALTVYEQGRTPRLLVRKALFDDPVVGAVVRSLGAICVDRFTTSPETSLADAEAALRAGECVVIMPEGTIAPGGALYGPPLAGRTGVARLAAATGAPVVPLAVWGSELVWPRSARLPNLTNVLHPPTVRVRMGPAVPGLSGTDLIADTDAVMKAVMTQLPAEARRPPNVNKGCAHPSVRQG